MEKTFAVHILFLYSKKIQHKNVIKRYVRAKAVFSSLLIVKSSDTLNNDKDIGRDHGNADGCHDTNNEPPRYFFDAENTTPRNKKKSTMPKLIEIKMGY